MKSLLEKTLMNKNTMILSVLLLLAGASIGYFIAPQSSSNMKMENAEQPDGKGKILFYRNAMNPSVTSPVPAKDNMGMDYKPVYADDSQNNDVAGTVKIDPVVVQNIGVRTAKAEIGNLSRTIRAVGKVDYDEEKMARIHPKTEGWIEKLFIDKIGETVKEDAILLSVYAPKLVSTQQEYLLALSNLKTLKKSSFPDISNGAKSLVKTTYERLQLLDVPEHQIKELQKTKKVKKNLHIHTPVAGTIMRIGAREGQYVTPNTELYMIVDLSQVWVYADIYEYEIPWVKLGDRVDMTLAGIPGKTFTGKISYIYPYAEAKTRTIRARVVFDNPDLKLRPEMFAEMSIHSEERKDVVIVPAEAVVRSGTRDQVFVVREKGKFEPRDVILGLESDGKVIILSGVSPGDTVVTSAQFLIDSESKLREATQKMLEVKPDNNVDSTIPPSEHIHGDDDDK
jgi:Cu(I)/Ag(I) efflux system membrane fusion protein